MAPDTPYPPRWQERPTARSMLLTVLGEYVYPGRRPVWTRTFLTALAAMGFHEGAARQALARSARAGLLVQERRGRYTHWTLTAEMQTILAAGTERIYNFGKGQTPWDGEWLVLQIRAAGVGRRRRYRLGTRLTWAGFGDLAPGLWISPHPHREKEAAHILEALGLAEHAISFRGRLGEIGDADWLVDRAWDLNAVAHRHREFQDHVETLSPTTRQERFVALTHLVHRWRFLLFADPDLPRDLLPRQWIGRRTTRRFHELHERWSKPAQAWWTARLEEA